MMLRAAVLRRASDLVGLENLSKRLGADRGAVSSWMLLEGVPPVRAFLEATDILFEHDFSTLGRRATDQTCRSSTRAPSARARSR